MTFAKQIEGVPISWVRQGWRLQPSNEFDSNWRQASPFNRWDYEAIEVDGAYLDIARPVIEPANGPRVYAHQGWGNHLTPTPEMVKVWPYWWVLRTDNALHPASVFALGDLVLDVHADHLYPIQEWRGPVLPPMEMSP